jgi:hypothetical protein
MCSITVITVFTARKKTAELLLRENPGFYYFLQQKRQPSDNDMEMHKELNLIRNKITL